MAKRSVGETMVGRTQCLGFVVSLAPREMIVYFLCVVCANVTGRNEQKVGGDDDYNMDENEAESETDKQAALAGNDRNVNGNDCGGVASF